MNSIEMQKVKAKAGLLADDLLGKFNTFLQHSDQMFRFLRVPVVHLSG